jgi:hypothetical protein
MQETFLWVSLLNHDLPDKGLVGARIPGLGCLVLVGKLFPLLPRIPGFPRHQGYGVALRQVPGGQAISSVTKAALG